MPDGPLVGLMWAIHTHTHTMQLLQDYGVGPNMMCLIASFWECHMVIPRQQAFFGNPFHADRGLATGDIPALLFYNVVTDTVIRQWYIDGSATGMTTKGHFYADDGELWDHNPAQLQMALASMEGLFIQMGLKINDRKTKALTTLPTIATTTISTPAYKRRMDSVGDTYRTRKQQWTICPICQMAMQMCSIKGHYASQHPNLPVPPPTLERLLQDPRADHYIVTEPDKHMDIQCPIPSCSVTMKGGWYAIWRHFLFRHHGIEVEVAEEAVMNPCSECGFRCALPHDKHKLSELCKAGRKRAECRVLTQQIIATQTQAPPLNAGNTDLAHVDSFKYLGQWMSANDSDTMAVSQNIARARIRWGQLCQLLTQQGALRKAMGLYYKATVQAVLLHGAETWTLTQPLVRMLHSFHHRCACYLVRMVNTQKEDGTWIIPPSQMA